MDTWLRETEMVEEKVSADHAANSNNQWSDIHAGPLGLALLVCGCFL
jgi:hypothetical protein